MKFFINDFFIFLFSDRFYAWYQLIKSIGIALFWQFMEGNYCQFKEYTTVCWGCFEKRQKKKNIGKERQNKFLASIRVRVTTDYVNTYNIFYPNWLSVRLRS